MHALGSATHPQPLWLQVVHFLTVYQPVLGLDAVPPLTTLERAAHGDAAARPALAAAAAALAALLLRDAWAAAADEYADDAGDVAAQRRDLQGGAPVVDGDTWPFAAAAIFAGARAAYLLRRFLLAKKPACDTDSMGVCRRGAGAVLCRDTRRGRQRLRACRHLARPYGSARPAPLAPLRHGRLHRRARAAPARRVPASRRAGGRGRGGAAPRCSACAGGR